MCTCERAPEIASAILGRAVSPSIRTSIALPSRGGAAPKAQLASVADNAWFQPTLRRRRRWCADIARSSDAPMARSTRSTTRGITAFAEGWASAGGRAVASGETVRSRMRSRRCSPRPGGPGGPPGPRRAARRRPERQAPRYWPATVLRGPGLVERRARPEGFRGAGCTLRCAAGWGPLAKASRLRLRGRSTPETFPQAHGVHANRWIQAETGPCPRPRARLLKPVLRQTPCWCVRPRVC